jgi:hypothetical protein
VLALAIAATATTLAAPPGGAAAVAAAAPMLDDESWIDIILDETHHILQKFIEVEMILSDMQWADLTREQREAINATLADTLADIDHILEGGELLPPVIGVVDGSIDPQNLSEYGDACVALTEAAMDELAAGSEQFNQPAYVSLLLTMRHLLTRAQPHNFTTVDN